MAERLRLIEQLVGEFGELAELVAAGEVEPDTLAALRAEIDAALRGVALAAARERRAAFPPNVLPFPDTGRRSVGE